VKVKDDGSKIEEVNGLIIDLGLVNSIDENAKAFSTMGLYEGNLVNFPPLAQVLHQSYQTKISSALNRFLVKNHRSLKQMAL
jgi:hypothetical protein